MNGIAIHNPHMCHQLLLFTVSLFQSFIVQTQAHDLTHTHWPAESKPFLSSSAEKPQYPCGPLTRAIENQRQNIQEQIRGCDEPHVF